MKLQKSFSAIMAATGLAVSMVAQAGDVGDSFNNQALSERLGASCPTQGAQRARLVRQLPAGTDPAPAFKNKGLTFVIESQQFDQRMKAEADVLFTKVPEHTKALAFNEGGVFVWSRYGLAESLPSRKNSMNGYIIPGLYLADQKRLYLTFMLAGLDKKFYEEPARRTRIINHEAGHMMDDMLGNYSHYNGRQQADGRLTDRRDYNDALNRDTKRMRQQKTDVTAFSYYAAGSIGGDHNDQQRLRREVFAELWAESSGYGGSGLSKHYPDTYRLVKGFYDHLADTYQAGGPRCVYKKDGSAVPASASKHVLDL